MPELPKAYVPHDAESKWYPFWEKNGFFRAAASPQARPYTIVIPPPNITGVLHMGHVLNNTIQDIFIRWKRMQGYAALWMPGTDHAGIATQNIVEKSLLKEGKTRHDLGREEFLKRVWEWKETYGGTIIRQLKMLGTSCDWERTRFTMDEGLSEAVQEMFIRLFAKGLIYRGKYIVNWCPKDHTAISDDEVNFVEQEDSLWYIRYPLTGGGEPAVVATTRPETLLGDTAVAVNPRDERYTALVGRTALLPLADREIPVIADESIDPAFGTGMVKVTPAHDPNDYWIGERHNAGIGQRHRMTPVSVLDISARMNDNAPPKYRGMDRYEARKAVVADLERLGLLVKRVPYVHNVGRCYRCDTVIEPYLSDQWFVRMKPLAEAAYRAVHDGTIRFHPDRWVKTYEHWMTNIRDWCISRQLWWGHRIPIWYCEGSVACTLECKRPVASRTRPAPCVHCGSSNFRQDEDVLDTWFSSWLWPFSTLGWPKDNPDLRYFYPTDTLVTGPDIIFFWVARMIMAGLEVMGDIPKPDGSPRTSDAEKVPFRDVYFTSIIRDGQGRKMSKSLGNSPDPIDVIAEYGADALRFTVVFLAPLGQDVLYENQKCEIGRNFANKVWNAGRFLLMNREQLGAGGAGEPGDRHLDLADRWILSRFHSTAAALEESLSAFEIHQAAKLLYEFTWHDFCDWYVEMVKTRLYGDEPTEVRRIVLERALGVFDALLRLLHPFMPFVTEELWQYLAPRAAGESIMVQRLPAPERKWIDPTAEAEMALVHSVINAVRNVRGELSVPPSREIRLLVRFSGPSGEATIGKYGRIIQRLARVAAIEPLGAGDPPGQSASAVIEGGELFIPLEGLIDLGAERDRIRKEMARVEGMIAGIRSKLGNESFIRKAPGEVVARERDKLSTFSENLEKLRQNLDRL